MTRRRSFLKAVGGAAALGTAGCMGGSSSPSYDTVRIGTYNSFIDAPSTSAGDWVKEEFESRHDLTLEWVVPDGGLQHFFQRQQQGADLGADAFIGVTPPDLVNADQELDDPLFTSYDTGAVENSDNVVDAYEFDPQNRVIPTGASYVSLVYDEGVVSPPETLEALTTEEYADTLLLANPQSTTTGLLFLLWTINTIGADSYLDYWADLMDNGVTILGSWGDAYAAYSEEEKPMVVSYSTDQVYASAENQDMSRHQIAFPNDQGYAYVDGTAKFAATDRGELVDTFTSFMLDPAVQQEVAVKNVGLPTVSNASLPEEFAQYAHEPEQPIQFGYDALAENLDTWREDWSRQVAEK
ncbi:thiamine ABC transporter substrate-binding protein [Haloarcula halophila]|uniref:thiamine ABC transporter substrate-binding protein n=1 Tax=Haloarcula TaxID=2237 RepID=UPI0023E40EDE|nr:thiamine ABC transporter substrate-binding protein [Halomicroarcula sp. DFY41]